MSIYPFRAAPSSCVNSEYQENVESVCPEETREPIARFRYIHFFILGGGWGGVCVLLK